MSRSNVLHYTPMPKKEKKRLQVVISDDQDALLTKAAYELSSPERLVSKSEVVRLAIEKIAREIQDGGGDLAPLLETLQDEEETDGDSNENGNSGV